MEVSICVLCCRLWPGVVLLTSFFDTTGANHSLGCFFSPFFWFILYHRNLWNFSPKHLFTDSSGMYWRERRLRPGLYTDGKTVYEASYRYRDGRNGMHRRSTFQQFMGSQSVDSKMKQRVLDRLKKDSPDVVLEE